MQGLELGQLLQLTPVPSVLREQEVCHGCLVLPGGRVVDGLSQPTEHYHSEKFKSYIEKLVTRHPFFVSRALVNLANVDFPVPWAPVIPTTSGFLSFRCLAAMCSARGTNQDSASIA